MLSNMTGRKAQFVITSSQSFGQNSEQNIAHRKIARSHAARTTHAKARRLRTLQYQAQKNHSVTPDSSTPQLVGVDLEQYYRQEIPMINVLSTSRKDPFDCSAVPLKPIEKMLFDHYVTIVVPLMSCHSANTEFCDLIARTWVPVARASANLLDIIFLLSCRHLHTSNAATDQEYLFMRKGLHYKSRCLKTLRDAISIEAPNFTDSTIAQAIMLAYDELFTRDLKMLKHHTEGALQMVKLKGGPDTLGLDGLLKDMLSKLVAKGSSEVRLDTRIVQGWTLGDHDW